MEFIRIGCLMVLGFMGGFVMLVYTAYFYVVAKERGKRVRGH